MKKKTGFTLIELLAVIVILAVIALIAVPVILNILNKSNKSAFKDTAYGILSAGELYFAEQQLELNGMSEEKTFNLSELNEELQLKGEVPEGTLKVNPKGQTALAVKNGRYCITKRYEDNDITITENYTNCTIPGEEEKEETNDIKLLDVVVDKTIPCLTSGVCELGTEISIQLNETTTNTFRVLSDDGNKVTLIMTEPVGDEVLWNSEETCYYDEEFEENRCYVDNSKGPLTVLQELENVTKTWKKLPEMKISTFDYDDGREVKLGNDKEFTTYARLPKYSELSILADEYSNMPDWYPQSVSSWTSTASTSDATYAWYLDLNWLWTAGLGTYCQIYPVIDLYK